MRKQLFPFAILLLLLISCGKEPCIIDGVITLKDNQALIDCKVNGSVIVSGKNILVKDVEINADGRNWGLLIDYHSENIVIDGVEAYGAKRFGIGSYGWPERTIKNVKILNSIAHHNLGDPEFTENWSGSGIFLEGVEDGLIKNSEAYENGELTNSQYKNGPVGIFFHNCLNSKIIGCKSFNNKTRKGHKDGAGFDMDGACVECSIIGCESWGNAGAGFLIWQWVGAGEIRDLQFIDCISKGDKYGLLIGSGEGLIPGVSVSGCSFTDSKTYAIWIRKDQIVPVSNSYICGPVELQRNGVMIEENNVYCPNN